MIKHVALKHSWFYFYRLHTTKLDSLCNNGLSSLKSYLETTFDNCPSDVFEKGPSGSKLRMDLGIKPVEIKQHEICQLAKQGLDTDHYKTAHSKVEVHLLQYDTKTIGVEIPIWLHANEWEPFQKHFESTDPLSGHIDVLRVDDGKVWVWDYKPNAEKEKFATTQTYFYALMLSKRTNISLEKFRCGYFDDKTSFVFKPNSFSLK